MEFSFDVDEILPAEVNLVWADSYCEGFFIVEEVNSSSGIDYSIGNWSHKIPDEPHVKDAAWRKLQGHLAEVINKLGKFSQLAQRLRMPVTCSTSLSLSRHRAYILKVYKNGRGVVIGLLKVGNKGIFVYDENNKLMEKPDCLCILDFYIIESEQKKGYGHRLFQEMLKMEDYCVGQLAYDAPSSKFINFLKKHYNLQNRLKQPTNIVIYRDFFIGNAAHKVHQPRYLHVYKHGAPGGTIMRYKRQEGQGSVKLPFRFRSDSSGAASCLTWDESYEDEKGVQKPRKTL